MHYTHKDKARAENLILQGLSPREIKKILPDVSGTNITSWKTKLGFPLLKQGRPLRAFNARTWKIRAELDKLCKPYRIGALAQIARDFGVSRQRVDQIIHEDKSRARSVTFEAIKLGVVKRPKQCSQCRASVPLHAHHTDYSKPFEVVFLCQPCHIKQHY